MAGRGSLDFSPARSLSLSSGSEGRSGRRRPLREGRLTGEVVGGARGASEGDMLAELAEIEVRRHRRHRALRLHVLLERVAPADLAKRGTLS